MATLETQDCERRINHTCKSMQKDRNIYQDLVFCEVIIHKLSIRKIAIKVKTSILAFAFCV